MPIYSISDLLFTAKTQSIPHVSGVTECHTGMHVPEAHRQMSSRRPTTARGAVTISRVALTLMQILKSPVNAVIGGDSRAYIERPSAVPVKCGYYDGVSTVKLDNGNLNTCLETLLISALGGSLPQFAETRAAFVKAAAEMHDTDAVQIGTLGYFCDCFYYDLKASKITEITAVPMTVMDRTEVEQAIRAGTVRKVSDTISKPVAGAPEIFCTNFTTIKYDPPADDTHGAVAPAAPMTPNDVLENAKMGAFEFPYPWDDMSRVAPISFLDNFIPTPSFAAGLKMIFDSMTATCEDMATMSEQDALARNYCNIRLIGKPGTGKSTITRAWSSAIGIPLYTAAVSKHTEEDEFQGKIKPSESGFEFKETDFLNCYKHGGIVVIEDFNLADPAVLQGALGNAIEPPFILMEDGVKPIHRHPMCIIVATQNVGTEGTREQNQAFTSRFPFTLEVEDPDEDAFIDELEKRSGRPRKDCKRVYRAYTDILTYITDTLHDDTLALSVTKRHCHKALQLLKYYDFKDAVYNTMITAIRAIDPVQGKEVFDNVISAKKY